MGAISNFKVAEATVDLLRIQRVLRDWAYEHGAEAIGTALSGGLNRAEEAVAILSYRMGGRVYSVRLSVAAVADQAVSVTRPGKRLT